MSNLHSGTNCPYLDLLLYRPQAYLLLSYLRLLRNEKGINTLGIAARPVLTKEQVRRNLRVLHEWGFVNAAKLKYPSGVRGLREVTILKKVISDV